MSQTIVQVNYKFRMSKADYIDMAGHAAQPIAAANGLIWKIWLMNEAGQEAGGIYLFASQEAARQFLNGPIVANLKENPQIEDIRVKLFAVVEALSEITRGPVATISVG